MTGFADVGEIEANLPPPVEGAVLRAALWPKDLRGAFPPVDLRAVYGGETR